MMIDRERAEATTAQPDRSIEDLLARKLGLIEILPAEKRHWEDIRFSAHQARMALGYGPEAAYFYDPRGVNRHPDLDHVRLFTGALTACRNNQRPDLGMLFPGADQGVALGVLRRIALFPADKVPALVNEKNLGLALGVVDAALASIKERKDVPTALIIAHTEVPDLIGLLRKTQGELSVTGGRRPVDTLKELMQMAVFMGFSPYLGAAVLGAELERDGRIGRVQIVDYSELDDRVRLENILREGAFRSCFLSGVLSHDIFKLQDRVQLAKSLGIRPISGGLGPTIDPYAFALSTKSDVFIGEAEGVMSLVLDVTNSAKADEYFIFHRGLPPGSDKTSKMIRIDDDVHSGLVHIYLNVPEYVNFDDHYSPQAERNGNLAARMKLEEGMQKPVSLGGKDYDPIPFAPTQMVGSVFCPSACPFCSSPGAHGTRPRRMPLESFRLRMQATESKLIVLVDQNWGAIGAGEAETEWAAMLQGYFSIVKGLGKRLLFQTSPSFLDRVGARPGLRRVVSDVVSGILIGVEQPRKQTKGNSDKKPELLRRRLAIARQLKIMVIGSIIVGLPPEMNVGGNGSDQSEITVVEWINFLRRLDVQCAWTFPFFAPPGAVGIPPTEKTALNPLGGYSSDLVRNKGDWDMVNLLNKNFYSPSRIIARFVRMIGYRKGRIAIAAGLNLGYLALHLSGRSVRDSLKVVKRGGVAGLH